MTPGDSTAREAATAFFVAMTAALAGNAVLQLALDAMTVGGGSGSPWWLVAGVIERGRWVALAGLLWLVAPRLLPHSADGAAPLARADVWQRVALLVLVLPLLWIAATWLVSALRFTALGSWTTEGRVFVAPEYYHGLLLDYAPWVIGGVVTRAVGRHL
ncbi:MAG: hypothetical protein IT178_14865 [Acidobacteria bacterium]|nr:hypothetical protein [Acidobacteriota bacterium]